LIIAAAIQRYATRFAVIIQTMSIASAKSMGLTLRQSHE
jgi:hypothetical protein